MTIVPWPHGELVTNGPGRPGSARPAFVEHVEQQFRQGLAIGHGAGAAASVAVSSRTSVQDVDVRAVQRMLRTQGANLG